MNEPMSLDACVRANLEMYFRDLDGLDPSNLHDMLVRVVEKPLLEVVMHRSGQNQSRAAEWLGLNRNTLRKKLLEHELVK
jgi:Fis family transcriptional regulator